MSSGDTNMELATEKGKRTRGRQSQPPPEEQPPYCPVASPTSPYQHQWGSSYLSWNGTVFGAKVEQTIQIKQFAPGSFHVYQFGFDFNMNGAGGYFGLQTSYTTSNNTVGTNVRFSIWDATEAIPSTHSSSSCRVFGGEGTGYTCTLLPFALGKDVFYTLTMDRLDTNSQGTMWRATITNTKSGVVTEIGRIRARNGSSPNRARPSVNFTEYFGPAAIDSYSVPQSIVRWQAPEVDGSKLQFSHFHGQSGVESTGNVITQPDGLTLFEMINGSVPYCM